MRIQLALLAALTFTACSTETPTGPEPTPTPEPGEQTGPKIITLDADALETARAVLAQRDPDAKLHVMDMWNNVAVVQFQGEDLKALSQLMHENHKRCGGFIVHESMEDALGALRAKDHEGIAPLIAYTIDNAATVNALLPQLSQSTLLTNIQQLSGGAGFNTRYYQSAGGAASSTWLRNLWQGYASGRPDVTIELWEHGWQQKSVIATIPGSALASEVVIVGGHLDSIASGGAAPGADDDASGIATLTEVFRVLMSQNYRPLRTVKFMAYAGEEVGLLGSKAIAQNFKTNNINVVGVMQLDMTNYKGSTGDIYLMQDYTNAAQNTFVGSLIDTYLPGVVRGTDSCGYGCSDHASWHNQGFAASMPFESRMSQYNPTIHTTSDTLAQSGNNANHAIKFARMATAYVAELAKGQLGTSSNTPPSVAITAPANGSSYPQGTSVVLTGTATDAQDGTISGSIVWTSSLDGSLGTGASRTVTLSAGSHTITARATDTGGLQGAATISVTITGPTVELLNETFESSPNWNPTGLWHNVASSTCTSPAAGYTSPVRAMYFGRDAQCNYATGARTSGQITSPIVTGVVATSSLRFKYFRRVESASGSYDVARVQIVSGSTTTTVWTRTSANASTAVWEDSGAISLSAFAGQSIQVRFFFDSMDSVANNFTGWLVDDVVITR